MANGDAAAAAGMDTVPGTNDRRMGYDEINKTRDYIAARTLRQARGQRSVASVGAGGSLNNIAIAFPANTFTAPPLVVCSTSNGRLTTGTTGITETGFVLSVNNWSPGPTPAGQTVFWYAVEA